MAWGGCGGQPCSCMHPLAAQLGQEGAVPPRFTWPQLPAAGTLLSIPHRCCPEHPNPVRLGQVEDAAAKQ